MTTKDDPNKTQYDQLVVKTREDMKLQLDKLDDVRFNPEQSSYLTTYDRPTSPIGEQFMTLYTGGTIVCSHEKYTQDLRPKFIADIIKGHKFAVSEKCPSRCGIRCFFELDYRSFVRFPTEDEMKSHCLMAFELIHESFPEANSFGRVAKCSEKLKYSNQGGPPKLAVGLHIVFPHVIVDTERLRQLCLTLDLRISIQDPMFSGVVDDSSVHTNCANLRPLYCYRLDQCKGCYGTRKATKEANSEPKKPFEKETGPTSKFAKHIEDWTHEKTDAINDYDSESEEDLEPMECKSQGCMAGKKVASPSIYEPWLIVVNQQTRIEANANKKEWMLEMSIVADTNKYSNYIPPKDAVHIKTINPRGNAIVYSKEKNLIGKSKTLQPLYPERDPALFKVVTSIIRQYDNIHFTKLVADQIQYSSFTRIMMVNVKGCGIHDCLYNGKPHSGNRIYFLLELKTNKKCIKLRCHKCDDRIKELQSKPWKEMSTKEQQLANQLTKDIPASFYPELGRALKLGLCWDVAEVIVDDGKSKSQPGQVSIRLPDGTSQPATYVYDAEHGDVCLPEELKMGKKRNLEELNPNYFYDDNAKSAPETIASKRHIQKQIEKTSNDHILDFKQMLQQYKNGMK